MTRAERAEANFNNGCNCAQAVFLAFADLAGMDEATAMRLTSGMGGGIGRLREVCGAVSGAALVLGLLYGQSGVPTKEEKAADYRRIQELALQFQAEEGSYLCRELLAGVTHDKSPVPEARTAAYYAARPCPHLVRRAAELVEARLAAQAPDAI